MPVSIVEISTIVIGNNRKRKEFPVAAMEELSDGIQDVGLINPIVIEMKEGIRYLVAGERRLKTITAFTDAYMFGSLKVAAGFIPCLDQGNIELLKARKIELFENTQRLDFTWQEKDAAMAAVQELMEEIEEEPITLDNLTRTLLKKESVSYNDKVKVEKALRRQEYAEDPLVSKAKSSKDADKIIESKLLETHKEKMAGMFKEIESPHNIIFADSIEHCKGYKDNTFDVVVSDPIYGIDMDKQNAFQRVKMQEGKLHGYDDSYINWKRMFDVMPEILYKITKEEAACYLFCDISRFDELSQRMEAAGWSVWNRPIIWYKGNIGSLPRPKHGPRYTYECILFATKGDRETTGVYHDVITIPQTTGHSHGAGKPIALYEELLSRCAHPGDRVLDFCAGSFPILTACNKLSLQCDAIELDEKWRNESEIRKVDSLN